MVILPRRGDQHKNRTSHFAASRDPNPHNPGFLIPNSNSNSNFSTPHLAIPRRFYYNARRQSLEEGVEGAA